jgi:antitoxin (DNA-binding transcriptional repressor) of toxin-antitoxin stability system
MPTRHISESELVQDIHSVLEQVRNGAEVVIEQDRHPVAVLRPASQEPGRLLSESIAIAREREKERGFAAILDPDFAGDVEEIVRSRALWTPTSWD